MDRDEITTIITNYGGKITTGISKKTKYVIIGEEAGPKKLATAIEYNIPTLSEDDFLNLIRDKSSFDNNKNSTTNITPKKSTKIKTEKSPKIKTENASKVADIIIKEHSDNRVTNSTTDAKRKLEINKNEIVTPKKIMKIDKNETKLPINKSVITAAAAAGADITDDNNKTWVDKYKPTNTKQIIGQQGAASNCVKYVCILLSIYFH